MPFSDMNPEHYGFPLELEPNIYEHFKRVPKPAFISNIVYDQPISICRPLFAPFNHLAITHKGVIFQFVDVKYHVLEDRSCMIPGEYIVPRKYTNSGRPFVSLNSRHGELHKNFLVDRLILYLFHSVPLYSKVDVGYLDGDPGNPHFNNLIGAYSVDQEDWHVISPLH